MLNDPKELIGNWFSNVTGRHDFYFVLEVNKIKTPTILPEYGEFVTRHVKIQPKKVKAVRVVWKDLKMWGDPITNLSTLTKLRYKAIKGIIK